MKRLIPVFLMLFYPVLISAQDSLFTDSFFEDDSIKSQITIRTGSNFKVINPFSKVKETGGIFMELGGRIDPDILVARIGVYKTYNGWFSFLGGLEALSDDDDHTFGGVTAGIRVKLPYVITPFVGISLFAGTYEEEVDADADGIDNDDDGSIDENDEKKWETTDAMVATCPEAGIMVFMDKNSQLVLSARHYFTDKGRDSDYWVYSIGINIVF